MPQARQNCRLHCPIGLRFRLVGSLTFYNDIVNRCILWVIGSLSAYLYSLRTYIKVSKYAQWYKSIIRELTKSLELLADWPPTSRSIAELFLQRTAIISRSSLELNQRPRCRAQPYEPGRRQCALLGHVCLAEEFLPAGSALLKRRTAVGAKPRCGQWSDTKGLWGGGVSTRYVEGCGREGWS